MLRPALIITLCATVLSAADLAGVDRGFATLKTYKVGDAYDDLRVLEAYVVESARHAAQAKAAAARFASFITTGGATDDGVSFACRQLWIIGGPDNVAALAGLLTSPGKSHWARYALHGIPGRAADDAMIAAIDKLDPARPDAAAMIAGLIDSLGVRRSAAAVPTLKRFAGRPGAAGEAAVIALGRIGSADAVSVLLAQQGKSPAAVDALLDAADRAAAAGSSDDAMKVYTRLFAAGNPPQVRSAALRGMAALQSDDAAVNLLAKALKDAQVRNTSARLLEAVKGPAATQALAGGLATADASVQPVILEALANRGDVSAAAAVLGALASATTPDVKAAALRAAGRLADASAVAAIAAGLTAAEAPVRDAAKEALTTMRDPGTSAALLAAVPAADERTQVELVKLLPARRAVDQVDALFKLAGDAGMKPAVRRAAVTGFGDLAPTDRLADAVALIVSETDSQVRDAAESAVAAIALRISDPRKRVEPIAAAHATSGGQTRAALLRTLGRLPGDASLSLVREDLGNSDPAIRDAAVRALTNWPDMAAADDLLRIVKNSQNETHRILALRGYIRLIAPGSGDTRTPAQVIKLHQDAMTLATRVDEKRAVLSGLAAIVDRAALDAVEAYASDKQLKNEVAAAKKKIQAALDKKKK